MRETLLSRAVMRSDDPGEAAQAPDLLPGRMGGGRSGELGFWRHSIALIRPLGAPSLFIGKLALQSIDAL
jgi:hypothetical protein